MNLINSYLSFEISIFTIIIFISVFIIIGIIVYIVLKAIKKRRIILNLPKTIYTTKDVQFNIYTSNLLDTNTWKYNIHYSTSEDITAKKISDRLEITAEGKGTLTVGVYIDNKLLISKTAQIITNENRETHIVALLLGDSTVRGNGYGHITGYVKEQLGDYITWLGTMKNEEGNYFEGRGGWTIAKYRTSDEAYGFINPFYSPEKDDFDFSYYMNTQKYSDIEVVILQFGINDVFSAKNRRGLQSRISKFLEGIRYLKKNILEYDNTIQIAINLTIPPTSNVEIFNSYYESEQTHKRYKINNTHLVHSILNELSDEFDLVNTNIVIDTTTNILDGVHPKEEGYRQMGGAVNGYVNSL